MDQNCSDISTEQYEKTLQYMETVSETSYQEALQVMRTHDFSLQAAISYKLGDHTSPPEKPKQKQLMDSEVQNNENNSVQNLQINYINRIHKKKKVSLMGKFMRGFTHAIYAMERFLRMAAQKILPQFMLRRFYYSPFYRRYRPLIALRYQDRKLNFYLKNGYLQKKPLLFLIASPNTTHDCFLKLLNSQPMIKKFNQSFYLTGTFSNDDQCRQITGEKKIPSVIVCRENILNQLVVTKKFVSAETISNIDVEKLNLALNDCQQISRKEKNNIFNYTEQLIQKQNGGLLRQFQQQLQQQNEGILPKAQKEGILPNQQKQKEGILPNQQKEKEGMLQILKQQKQAILQNQFHENERIRYKQRKQKIEGMLWKPERKRFQRKLKERYQQDNSQLDEKDSQNSCQIIRKQNEEYRKMQSQNQQKKSKIMHEEEKQKMHLLKIQHQRNLKRMTIPEQPHQGDIIRINFRLPNGNVLTRNFDSNHNISMIYNWVETHPEIEFEDNVKRSFQLMSGFPPVSLETQREHKLKDVFDSDQEKIIINEL